MTAHETQDEIAARGRAAVDPAPELWHLGDRSAIYTASSAYVKRCGTREEAEGEIAAHNALVIAAPSTWRTEKSAPPEPVEPWRPEASDETPDMVNHPPHYSGLPCGVEVIAITEHLTFSRGNAVKYLLRAGKKGTRETEIEDLRKAAWYATREADRLEAVRNEASS